MTYDTDTDMGETSVCVDCAMMLANGEGTEEHAERIAARWQAQGYDLVLACDEECEGWFSWLDCDGCGSTLGGDRHPAHWIKREERA